MAEISTIDEVRTAQIRAMAVEAAIRGAMEGGDEKQAVLEIAAQVSDLLRQLHERLCAEHREGGGK